MGGIETLPQIAFCHPGIVLAAKEALVDHHLDKLLDEERVAFGRGGDSRAYFVGDLCLLEHVLDYLPNVLLGERLEQDPPFHRPLAPVVLDLEQLVAREADEQDRRLLDLSRQVLDELEEGRLSPVNVL